MTSTETIPQFYAGKNIFITGATGFLGKALIEKLLRSCSQIGNIYILVRPKRGQHVKDRILTLTNDPLYERLKQEQPNLKMETKIIPLSGDIKQLNLGISIEDRNILVQNVNIIFHVAASVRFDDSLQDAVITNIRGTREICQIALDAKKIIAFIHVSTAFVNCDIFDVQEKLYPCKMDWRKIIEIAEKCDKTILTALTEKIMDGIPNTYCYTKGIAEHVANEMMAKKIPCKIFRPSIVISSMLDEPVKGWIDNFNGPMGILIANGKGILRTTYAPKHTHPDYIPVDVITKALLASTWDLCQRTRTRAPAAAEVVHGAAHSAQWLRPSSDTLSTVGLQALDLVPLNDVVWFPSGHTTSYIWVWYLRTVVCMLLPSMVVDGVLMLAGKKPILTRLQKKIFNAQLALRYFMTHTWNFHNTNLLAVLSRIPVPDKQDWDYDFQDYDFLEYAKAGIIGARRYLLHEPDTSISQAKKHYNRMWWLSKISWYAFLGLCFWVLWRSAVGSSGVGIVRL